MTTPSLQVSLAVVPRPRSLECSDGLRVRLHTLADINEKFERDWAELEADSGIRNPFLSPGFVLAAARHLPELAAPLIVTFEQNRTLQGLGVFESCAGSRHLPVRHLRSWQTPHTYFDAPLFRLGMAERCMEQFWHFLMRGRHEWHGVEFPRFPADEPVSRVFDGTAQAASLPCLEGKRWQRAQLITRDCEAGDIVEGISVKRMKSLRRGWRELEKLGQIRFEFQTDPKQIPACAEELMQLENMGWKAEVGTALGAQKSHQQFFREMIGRLNQQRNVFFSRILVNDQAAVSVAHLVAGDQAYAFKLGWNPKTERGCPGFQVKLQAAARIHSDLPHLQSIDSCSSPGSFIEHVWPHRRTFSKRTYATSPVGQLTAGMAQGLRWVKNNAVAVSRHLFHSDQETPHA